MPGTRAISGRELRSLYTKLGRKKALEHLTECLEQKILRPTDFSIRDLAENFVPDGREWVRNMNPKSGNWGADNLLEAGEVAFADFSNITGQIFFTTVLEKYNDEDFVFSKACKSVQSKIPGMERIPGISRLGNNAAYVKEGEAYPYSGVSEDYIDIATKRKKGEIVAVTKEAVMFDLTGQLLDRCGEVGYYLGYDLETRVIDAFIDENAGAASAANGGHRYHWKGTSYATYQTSTPYINDIASGNALVDWTDVEAAYLLFAAMTDPYTGLPISIIPTHMIVTPTLLYTARRVVRATNIQTHVGGYATSGNLMDEHAPSPLDPYEILSSRILAARQATDTWWFLCKPSSCVQRTYNWDITTAQLGVGSQDEFTRDVVTQFKASVRDTVSVIQPRAIVRSKP